MSYNTMSTEELRVLRMKKFNEISRYSNIQMAKKIQLNSLYGALA